MHLFYTFVKFDLRRYRETIQPNMIALFTITHWCVITLYNLVFSFMYPVLSKINSLSLLGLSICLLLTACDSSKPIDQQSKVADAQQASRENASPSASEPTSTNQGKKLTEVAGQATLPASIHPTDAAHAAKVSEQAEKFVGRYYAEISCEDRFVMCDRGKAEFIINLLPDGTAHRTIVYMGKMTYENSEIKSNRSYQKNTWHYDEKNHEIIVNRIEGGQFFYRVDADGNLVMDLDQISSKAENSLTPEKAYVLTKFDHE